jgi:hypothetical protein
MIRFSFGEGDPTMAQRISQGLSQRTLDGAGVRQNLHPGIKMFTQVSKLTPSYQN